MRKTLSVSKMGSKSSGTLSKSTSNKDVSDVSISKRPTLGIDRAAALIAFRRFSYGGEVAVDKLATALRCAGQHQVQDKWITDIIHGDPFHDRGFLDRGDFFEFVTQYESRQKGELEVEFNAADLDGTGSMSSGELSSYLRKEGATPMPGVVEAIILEVTGSHDKGVRLRLEDFLQVHLILQERSGFTLKEEAHLKEVFMRFAGPDRLIQVSELRQAITWMGFVTSREAVENFVEEAGFTLGGGVWQSMSFGDFLVVCRRHREYEILQYRDAFHDADKDMSGTIDAEELPSIFEELDYMAASPEVLRECRSLCGLQGKRELTIEDLMVLLEMFRSKDGFLQSELDEIDEVFHKFSVKDGNAENLAGIHLGAATRWMGFPASIQEVQEICTEHDMDGNGGLDLPEFVRLMMRYRELEIRRVRRVFAHHDADSNAKLCAKELSVVLLQSGIMPAQAHVDEVLARVGGPDRERELGLWEFVGVVETYRREVRDKIRSNLCFTDLEVKQLKKRFLKFDPKSTGRVTGSYLADMLADLFPAAETCLDAHAEVRALLRVSDVKGDGQLDWGEYLGMMRQVQDKRDELRLRRLHDAIKATGFKPEELAEFRKVFQRFDADRSGDMSLGEFEEMMGNVVPKWSIRGARAQELFEHFHQADDDKNRVLDFGEFLKIIRALMDSNWDDINTAAAASSTTAAAASSAEARRGTATAWA